MGGLGDTAVALLKAGAETDKKDADGFLALDLAPDKEVSDTSVSMDFAYDVLTALGAQIHRADG